MQFVLNDKFSNLEVMKVFKWHATAIEMSVEGEGNGNFKTETYLLVVHIQLVVL